MTVCVVKQLPDKNHGLGEQRAAAPFSCYYKTFLCKYYFKEKLVDLDNIIFEIFFILKKQYEHEVKTQTLLNTNFIQLQPCCLIIP